MPATALTPISYSRNAGALFTWENPDQAGGNTFINTGREILIVYNGDASSRTVTFVSVADPVYGRTENIVQIIAQYEVAHFGPFDGEGWNQADGTISVTWSSGTTTTTKVRVARFG
jgi:hypothetical protein